MQEMAKYMPHEPKSSRFGGTLGRVDVVSSLDLLTARAYAPLF